MGGAAAQVMVGRAVAHPAATPEPHVTVARNRPTEETAPRRGNVHDGAYPDPAGELGPAIRQAREHAANEGRELVVVTSVPGTEGDPQGQSGCVRALEEAGAVVCGCNAAAARLAGFIVA